MVAAAKARVDGRYKKWHSALPKEQLEEVLALKVSFLAGDIGVSARSLAMAIIDDLDSQGLKSCSLETLRTWLTER